MYHSQLTDAIFYNSLLALDRIIAEQVKQSGCLFCHSNLHQSHYPRKPRGVPEGTHSDYPIRFSYCCGTDGCRKRFTPPSMRFLSRKVYSSVIIFLVFLLKSKTSARHRAPHDRFWDSMSQNRFATRRIFWLQTPCVRLDYAQCRFVKATTNGSTAIRDKILASFASANIGKFPCAFWRLSAYPGLTALERLKS